MKDKKVFITLAFIIILAFFLRVYDLSNVPPGVNRDEASIGYTAYSLLLTGKDEYGREFPISFQSFGDYKLPLYIYITTIFVKIFGLTELAVRLPSAIFGVATVGLTYFLVKELFVNRTQLAFFTSFLLAISPWAVHLSRVESESNMAVFFIVLGLLLFLKSLKNKRLLIIPSFILWALTYYTYAGNHVFTTIFVIAIILLYKSQIVKNKWSYLSLGLFIVLSTFIFFHTLLGADKTKISGTGIFGETGIVHAKIELLRNEHRDSGSFTTKGFHNTLFFAMERFLQNYLSAFSPDFLFIKGGTNSAHNIANFGNMYIVESLFLLFGISYLFIRKKEKEEKLILLWFFIAPIAASITKDAPHSNRMFAIFPTLPLVTAMGVLWFINAIGKKKILRNITIIIITFLFIVNFSLYIDRYYVHFPKNEARNWGLGYKELSAILSEKQFKNKKVLISKPEESPYIFLLFYSKYDPSRYQKEVVRYQPTSDGFIHVKQYSRFEFRHIDWSKEIKVQNQILVDVPLAISEFTRKQKFPTREVILPNDEIIFAVVEVDDRQIIH